MIAYSSHEDVARLADRLAEKWGKGGLKDIFFVACGGSLGGLAPMHHLIDTASKTIRSTQMNANEFVYAPPKALGESSLVIAMSMSGNTPETCRAARRAREAGATVVTFSHAAGSPLEQAGHFHVRYGFKDSPYTLTNNALLLRFGFELLRAFEDCELYPQALAAFDILEDVCQKAYTASAEPALAFARQYRDEEQFYTVGSAGSSWVAYTTCICHLMEMEWIHCGYIHSGELFHGPLEIAQPGTAFLVFVNSSSTRALDLRAVRFLESHTDRLTVLDADAYGANRFDPSVAGFFESMLLSIVARQYTETLAREKRHPFGYRRYMFKVPY